MTDDDLSHDAKIHQLCHDLQNCLNVISMGTDVLADSRNDDALFAEFYETVCQERRTATTLLNELLKTACKACSETGFLPRQGNNEQA